MATTVDTSPVATSTTRSRASASCRDHGWSSLSRPPPVGRVAVERRTRQASTAAVGGRGDPTQGSDLGICRRVAYRGPANLGARQFRPYGKAPDGVPLRRAARDPETVGGPG